MAAEQDAAPKGLEKKKAASVGRPWSLGGNARGDHDGVATRVAPL